MKEYTRLFIRQLKKISMETGEPAYLLNNGKVITHRQFQKLPKYARLNVVAEYIYETDQLWEL